MFDADALPPDLYESTDSNHDLVDEIHERHKRVQRLENEITHLAGHINAINYRFIKLLQDFDESGGWQVDGVKTFAHWLNWKCGIGALEAREKIRVAKSLPDLPGIDEAFMRGEISYSKVRAMTRVATPNNESMLLTIARHGTAQHVEQLVRKYRRHRKLDDIEHREAQVPDLTHYQDQAGMMHLHIKLPAEDAALVIQAVEKLAKHVRQEEKLEKVLAEQKTPEKPEAQNVSAQAEYVSAETFSESSAELVDPPPGFNADRATALVHMAEHYLATSGRKGRSDGPATLSGADRHEVIVHVNANEAHRDHVIEDGPCCYLDHNRFLSPSVARRLACDAMVTTVTEDDDGNVLNIGRRSRTISKALRTALKIRDGGCRFPNCHQEIWTDAHHIHHWADGGETNLDNLITLCRHHHQLLHRGDYKIERQADQPGKIIFLNSQLNPITRELYPLLQKNKGQTDNPDRVIKEILLDHSDLEIEPETAITKWRGEGIDYRDAVWLLAEIDSNRTG